MRSSKNGVRRGMSQYDCLDCTRSNLKEKSITWSFSKSLYINHLALSFRNVLSPAKKRDSMENWESLTIAHICIEFIQEWSDIKESNRGIHDPEAFQLTEHFLKLVDIAALLTTPTAIISGLKLYPVSLETKGGYCAKENLRTSRLHTFASSTIWNA